MQPRAEFGRTSRVWEVANLASAAVACAARSSASSTVHMRTCGKGGRRGEHLHASSSTVHMRTLRCATHAAIASRRTTASATIPCCPRAAFNTEASRGSSGVSSQHSLAHLWGGERRRGEHLHAAVSSQHSLAHLWEGGRRRGEHLHAAVSSQHSLAHRARSTRPSSASSAWYAKRAAASPAESAVLGTGRESSHERSHPGSRKTTASAPW
jgi:hypothetical protein